MVFKNKIVNKFWRFSSSFQLGIPILVVIAMLIAWGTIVESQYDAYAAKKMVYDSWMMWMAMCLLVYNLTIVVLDRWPWQFKHYPFITVHAGLVVIVFGGFVTSEYGLDGQMVVNINSKNNMVSVSQTDLVLYATFDGDKYSKIVDREVDFYKQAPTPEKPYVLALGTEKIEIIEYVKYARLQNKIKATQDETAGSSIRFQIMNERVKQVEQITQTRKGKLTSFNLGPAKIHVGEVPALMTAENEIYLTPLNADKVQYTIRNKDSKKPTRSGTLEIGQLVQTGWMGLELRLLDYIPSAVEEYEVTSLAKPNPLTTSAIKIRYNDIVKWLVLNDVVKLFGSDKAYLLSYQNRRLALGFDLKLNKFEIQRYQGTMRAMQYSSDVEAIATTQGVAQVNVDQQYIQKVSQKISMNEPLKFMGYTIYQASFQEDGQTGQPIASVFSINQDPGRWIKYMGCLIFSLGVVWLFYQRRKRATAT